MLSDLCICAQGARHPYEALLAMDEAREVVRVRKIQNLTIPWGTAEWRAGMEAEFDFLKVCRSSGSATIDSYQLPLL